MHDFKTFQTKRDFLAHIESLLGPDGNRELAEKVFMVTCTEPEWAYIRPAYGADWSEFLEKFDPWAILQDVDDHEKLDELQRDFRNS